MRSRYQDRRLYTKPDSRFIWARVRDRTGKIIRVSTRCTGEEAASRFADEWEKAAVDPSYRAASEATLESGLKQYMAAIVDKSAATQEVERTKGGHFLRVWGLQWPLMRITGALVLDYIAQRKREGVKPHTIKKELGTLRRALALAKFRGEFRRDLGEVFPPNFSGEYRPKTRCPTPEEFFKLIAELEARRAAQLSWIVATGGRKAESFRAERADVDWTRGVVRIRGTKTDRADAEIPITPITKPFLEWALQNAPGRTVLFDAWGNLHRDIEAACERAGIEQLSPNDLRRAFATWHRQAGVTAEQVSMLLRHTTDKLAQTVYGRISGEDLGHLLRTVLIPDTPASESEGNVDQPKDETPGKQVRPVRFERTTFGFEGLASTNAATRRSHGTKLGLAKKKLGRNVSKPGKGGPHGAT